VRLFQLLRSVREAGGRTLLDVGGSEGYFSQLCRELFGMEVMSVDLSEEACGRAAELFAVPGAAVEAAALPFATGTFDTVTCAEVVEHLAQPVPAILELQRVAKGALVLSTEEWQSSAAERDRILAERHLAPHGERSIFADVDLRPLFAPYEVTFERQRVPDLARFGDDARIDTAALRDLMLGMAKADREATTMGIVLQARKPVPRVPPPRAPSDAEIAAHLLRRRQDLHVMGARTPVVPWPAGVTPCCTSCGEPLRQQSGGLACRCGQSVARRRGVLAFLPDLPAFETRIDRMLGQRGGAAYPAQRADLLALAAALAMPFTVATAWRFDTGESAGWRANDHLVPTAPGRYRVTGHDPSLIHDAIGCDRAAAALVTVEMAVQPDDGRKSDLAEMFWCTDLQLSFSVDCCAGVRVITDGKFHTYTFQAPLSLSGAVLVSLRLDPLSLGRGQVEIRSLRLHADGTD
jgi:hypothetical protein